MENHDHDYLTDQDPYDYWREQEAAAEEYLEDNWGHPGDCLNCGGKDYACFCTEVWP